MTQQEAELLAARLIRIWGIVRVRKTGLMRDESRRFYFSGFSDEFSFRADERNQGSLSFVLRQPLKESLWGNLYYVTGRVLSSSPLDLEDWQKELQIQFASRWLPLFRRNCWLSGALVEATAHEKAEWIQDFTREEIESWNLQF